MKKRFLYFSGKKKERERERFAISKIIFAKYFEWNFNPIVSDSVCRICVKTDLGIHKNIPHISK
jgi:hypothetical protein